MSGPRQQFGLGDIVTLPALSWVATHGAGKSSLIIRPPEAVRIEALVPLAGRHAGAGPALRLEGGQIVLIRESGALPSGVHGMLATREDGSLKWRRHRDSDRFKAELSKEGLRAISNAVATSWSAAFRFVDERHDEHGRLIRSGLRPAQLGALHAVASHWSIGKRPATVVMPTGTGKTETMLAVLAALETGRMLVVVPSSVLRLQTSAKFGTLGLLRQLGNLPASVQNPIVGVVTRRPQALADLDALADCNVVVSTAAALSGGTVRPLLGELAKRFDVLVVDEAHHVAADTWAELRDAFASKRVLQFTATPFRRDGKLVDGDVIYTYPLALAQRDGYFKPIAFTPVHEIDPEEGDNEIAATAVAQLEKDLTAGFDHLLFARCRTIDRARHVAKLYETRAAKLNPVVVDSDGDDMGRSLEALHSRKSRIVVAVNMLGEGFDLPELKVAALHDPHKSLAVLMQFAGRFTRRGGAKIGNATVVANLADIDTSSALERLYREDADWNQLLSELSSEAASTHAALIRFLNDSTRLDQNDAGDAASISNQLLRPLFNTLVFNAENWTPKKFPEGLSKGVDVQRVWLNERERTLYFVTLEKLALPWTRSKKIVDAQWHLFVVHHDEKRNLIYLSSSDKSSLHEGLAHAVGAKGILAGDSVFRALGHINRLVFQNVGVKKVGRRNLRYAMYTGADVAQALSIAERQSSVKANLSGTGWERGVPVTIGCSLKGRVWSREPGTIPEFAAWARRIGAKLTDATIDTTQIIKNVLVPTEVESLPDKTILGLEWPVELLRQSEERVSFIVDADEVPLALVDIQGGKADVGGSTIECILTTPDADQWVTLSLRIGGTDGFAVTGGAGARIRIGRNEHDLAEYLSNYPPLVRFVDMSELDGNLLIAPVNPQDVELPSGSLEAWDWTGTDITKESMWKADVERKDSVQWRTAQECLNLGFQIVFDDDAPGEASDLVCLSEADDHIRMALIHCKFAGGVDAGERIKDVVEVSSQAIRSAKWKGKFRDLCRHIAIREKKLRRGSRLTRFLAGDVAALKRIERAARFKEIQPEVRIVQPGLSVSGIGGDQRAVLAATHSYLKETIGVELRIVGSA